MPRPPIRARHNALLVPCLAIALIGSLAATGGAEVRSAAAQAGAADVGAASHLLRFPTLSRDAIAFTRGKLARPDFTEKDPVEIVDKEREKLAEQEALHAKLVASLSWVG